MSDRRARSLFDDVRVSLGRLDDLSCQLEKVRAAAATSSRHVRPTRTARRECAPSRVQLGRLSAYARPHSRFDWCIPLI